MTLLLYILAAIGIVVVLALLVLTAAFIRARVAIREQYRVPGPYL